MMVGRESATAAGAHEKRLRTWRNLAPPQTRLVIDRTVEDLVPALEAEGFKRVDFSLVDPTYPTSGSEIVMERVAGEYVDAVTFNFEKYRRPRVQIQCTRRELSEPHNLVRSANLVRKNTQYYYFWGKPWWLPTRLWPATASGRALDLAKAQLGQIPRFLESGERGPNISKQVNVTVRQGAA